ncbi:MAG: hypothetical protein Q8L68_01610 [Methylococcales bacterium]|nr:hypothetical protein [Methylococcales bacterium]
MSFEKVRIVGVERLVSKKTGEVHNFLDIQILQSQRIYLNDVMLKNLTIYESLRGQECLLPVGWTDYQGKPSLNLADTGLPIILPGSSQVVEQSAVQVEQTKTNNPLFKSTRVSGNL